MLGKVVSHLSATIYDPDRRLDHLAVALRAVALDVVVTDESSRASHPVDLLFLGGPEGGRAAVHDQASRFAGAPLIVEMVDDDASAEVDAALERGAHDVLVRGRLGRLQVLLRRANARRRRVTTPEASLLANVSDLVMQVDGAGVVSYMNREGPLVDVAKGVGLEVLEHFPRNLHPLVRRLLTEARDTHELRAFDFRVNAHTYRVRIVPSEARALTLVASDLTEISDALARLGESEARAEAILAAMPDLVFRMTEDGSFLDVHAPQSSELLLPPSEISGRKASAILPPDIASMVETAIKRVVATRTAEVVTYDLDLRGTTSSFEARLVPIGKDQVLAIVRNMTTENRKRDRLALAERLASLGTMAAGVAHEINGPLTFVMLGLEWLEQRIVALDPQSAGGSKASPLNERLKDVLDGVTRIQRIVRDLRGFTRHDDNDDALSDATSALEGALSLAAAEVRYRARVEKAYGTVPLVRGSHARLGQVFANLIVNAAHALPEDQAADNVVRLRTYLAGDGRVAIEVSDTGRGISPEHLPRLFEPFFTTKAPGHGTGLGLWVCHEIVKELDGEIVVESQIGKGSTFRVLLPVGIAKTTEGPIAPPLPPPRARILVVDDEPNLAKTLAILLDDHTVEIALGGEAALARLESDREFDLILCDLMMPIVTGMDVYAAVEARWPVLSERFAFMTGGAFTPRARAFLDACGRPRLDKPFRAEGVKALLREEAERRAAARSEAQ
jgi:signal transduction histidine kinase/CheY-like chemotaxis protein